MIERKGRKVEENPGIGKNEGGNEASQDIVVHASLNDRWLFYTTALTMEKKSQEERCYSLDMEHSTNWRFRVSIAESGFVTPSDHSSGTLDQ